MTRKQPGPVRMMVDNMFKMARASGLSLEQVADFYDAIALIQKEASAPSTDAPEPAISKTVQ